MYSPKQNLSTSPVPARTISLFSESCPLEAEAVGHRLQNSPDSSTRWAQAGLMGQAPQQLCLIPTSMPLAIPFPSNAFSYHSSHPNFTSFRKSLLHWLSPPFLLGFLVSAGKSAWAFRHSPSIRAGITGWNPLRWRILSLYWAPPIPRPGAPGARDRDRMPNTSTPSS